MSVGLAQKRATARLTAREAARVPAAIDVCAAVLKAAGGALGVGVTGRERRGEERESRIHCGAVTEIRADGKDRRVTVPAHPKIYHIVHVDRLASIVADGGLLCDAAVARKSSPGTTIGMSTIKQRRLTELPLDSHPGLYVGECVPFYFCPRSIMLYLVWQANHPELSYRGGQVPIVHLEADMKDAVAWADTQGRRWAFTLSNAGAYYFEDRANLAQLGEVDWNAVQATNWSQCKEGKQAEFLMDQSFPWALIQRIGVHSTSTHTQVLQAFKGTAHRPAVEVRRGWYY